MLRSRLLVAVLIVTGVSCSKKEEAPVGGGDKPVEKPADKPAVAAKPDTKAEEAPPPLAPVKAGPSSDDLAFLPSDAESIIGINFQQVLKSPLWAEYISGRVMSDDVKGHFEELKKSCGYDPLASLKSVTLGLKPVGDGKEGVIVIHGADKAKALACADKLKTSSTKADVTHDGDVVIIKKKGGTDALALTFTDDTTAIATVGSKATSDGVKAAAASKSGLDKEARFVDLYNKLDTTKSLWFVVKNKDAFKAMARMGLKPKALTGALDVTSGIAVEMNFRLESADVATQMALQMKQQLGMAGGMLHLEKSDASSDGPDLKLSMSVSAANVVAVAKQLKAMQGMGGGGGMGNP